MNSYDYVRQKVEKRRNEMRKKFGEIFQRVITLWSLNNLSLLEKLLIFSIEISLGAFRSLTYEQTRELNTDAYELCLLLTLYLHLKHEASAHFQKRKIEKSCPITCT